MLNTSSIINSIFPYHGLVVHMKSGRKFTVHCKTYKFKHTAESVTSFNFTGLTKKSRRIRWISIPEIERIETFNSLRPWFMK